MVQAINNRGYKVDQSQTSTTTRLYAIENKDKRNLARQKRYEDPQYRREKNDIRNHSKKLKYEKSRQTLFKILGGRICIQCGFTDARALQFEHIFDDGWKDKLRFARYDQMMDFYIRYPFRARETLQVYCSNCNQIKVAEFKSYS